jgi:opacity protein-like surface antigen
VISGYDSSGYYVLFLQIQTRKTNIHPVKRVILIPFLLIIIFQNQANAQELDRSTSISLFAGAINYQGDLNPNSFTYRHSFFTGGIIVRKPLSRWFSVRAGATVGKISSADRWNRTYLQTRNLSFTTSLQELYAGLEVNILDISTKRFTPYAYGGLAVFHFNPWTHDNNGVKTFLKPLSTEGQGLPQYPTQKPYALTQFAFAFGGGLKFAVSDNFTVGVELSQRKTFTDYLDDVSSHYVDRDVLLQAKGPKAVELSFREDEVPNGRMQFPAHGEQRGTPSEMDWYYFSGVSLEMKMSALGGLFRSNRSVSSQRCPRFPY